jgi:hemolysin activation/secretion protein
MTNKKMIKNSYKPMMPLARCVHMLACSLIGVLSFNSAWAQVPASPAQTEQLRQQIDRQINTSRDRIEVPLPRTQNFDLRLQSPEKSAIPKAIDELRFEVKGFDLDGMQHYRHAEVDPLFAHLIGKKVSLEEVREAAAALEKKYRADGFFLSRVFIPPQRVDSGVFKVKVFEGAIGAVYVQGDNSQINAEIQAIASNLTHIVPIDLASLERVLLLLNDLPGASGSGVLRQGAKEGTTELLINASQVSDVHIVSANNTGSNVTGPLSIAYTGLYAQPFGLNGSLELGATGTGSRLEEVESVNARYSRALGDSGLQGSVGGLASRSLPGGSLKALDIRSDSTSFSPRLRYPLLRGRVNSIYLDTGLSINRTTTTLAGVLLTNDHSTVGDLNASWVLNGWGNGTQTTGLGVYHGLKFLNAMDKGQANASVTGFEPDFTKYTLSFQRLQSLPNRFSLQLLANAQYTQDKLLSGEQIAFGGPVLGRGFDSATLSADKGYGALLELRYDAKSSPWAQISPIQYYFSLDHAYTRSLGVDNPANPASPLVVAESNTINSAALGMRFSVVQKVFIDLQVADGHKRVTGADARHNPRLLASLLYFF